MQTWVDPVTRYIHIIYRMPPDAPDEATVRCWWSPAEREDWHQARVIPFISETGLRLASSEQWSQWMEGHLIERRAAGLERTVLFNPYPEAQQQGQVDVQFRIQIQKPDGTPLATEQTRILADNSDVVSIEDWSQVLQCEAVDINTDSGAPKWLWRTDLDPSTASFGNALYGNPKSRPLPQLTYPLSLRGWYAIFVQGDSIRMRLTGDERTDRIGSRRPFEEVFWRWCRMDRQHLVLKQPHTYTGYSAGHIDYVRLVPLSEGTVKRMEALYGRRPDRVVVGYFEPYSWAFYDDIQEALQHREPLAAFAEARIPIVDIQIGRFGAKVVYESRRADQLLYSTIGDPEPDNPNPRTDNVGQMQQYTNTLAAGLRYTRELGLKAHANFGASNCYLGTPLQGDFSKKHPEWVRGHTLRYEVPEVREYVLSLYREALEIGAPGISIDFCRYPDCIDTPETGNLFLRSLRKLADEFGRARGKRVPVLVRFPARGVHLWQNFNYVTWAREGVVDYLCPSNIQGRHHHFDIRPYLQAVRGTRCKLLPCVDGLEWGPEMPGLFLWRVKQLYDEGVDGVYVYQADGRILGRPEDRRCMRLLGSRSAITRWWKLDAGMRPHCSKGIYITRPSYPEGYNAWERLRVWLEGIKMSELEMYLDGKLISRYNGPPYVLGTEEHESDRIIPPGEHSLLIRAKDGEGWLEQSFTIRGAG